MGLTFGGAVSDVVSHGSASVIDNLDPYTILMWLFPTTLTAGRKIIAQGAAAGNDRRMDVTVNAVGGSIAVQVDRATTDAAFITNTNPLVLNTWNFLAVSFDSAEATASEAVDIYVGSLTALATECGYVVSSNGSGSPASSTANSILVGNNSTALLAFQGNIAVVQIVNRVLTVGEIGSLQFNPRVVTGTILFSHYHAAGITQPDWSGNGNGGTITGATQAAHVPLRSAFATKGDY